MPPSLPPPPQSSAAVSPATLRRLALHPDCAGARDALLASAEASATLAGRRSVLGMLSLSVTHPPSVGRRREVFDAAGAKGLGSLARSEGEPAALDPMANAAYDATGTTYDFYASVLRRDSIDGLGMRIETTVNSGFAPDNAMWSGSRLLLGERTPKGPFVRCFATALDVVAHEITHGVLQYAVPGGGLSHEGQAGALAESWCDVLGCVVLQWHRQEVATAAEWAIGGGLLDPGFGAALRSLAAPGTAWIGDDQPSDMSGYVNGGDPHTNSGIPNHAFYLAATALGGRSWEKAAPIWYRALALLTPRATFAEAAQATVDAATLLYGAGSLEVEVVTEAWQRVKVL